MYKGNKTRRNRLAVVVLAVVTVYYLTARWGLFEAPPSTFARLEVLMNRELPNAPVVEAKKSSFDWSRAEHKLAPKTLIGLPESRGHLLPRVQHKFAKESPSARAIREGRRQQVLQVFQRDWAAYRQHAWMKDVLRPLSLKGRDQFSGWSATLVDSLDTLWILGLRAEFDEAVAAVAGIDFGNSTTPTVNVFETNIRYLGGLIAAYDLSGRAALLAKATELGDLLYAAFNTANGMPVDFLDFGRAKRGEAQVAEPTVVAASPGTLSLEMTRLSLITGDAKYFDAVARLMGVFRDGQKATKLPGLWPTYVSMRRANVTEGGDFTLAGNADSLYEYLPKMYALLGAGAGDMYADMAGSFLDAAARHMLFRPLVPGGGADLLMAGMATVSESLSRPAISLKAETEHLACYLGGAFALAGRLLQRPGDIDTGAKLARGCAYSYAAMPSRVGPERSTMVACDGKEQSCAWDARRWRAERVEHDVPEGFVSVTDRRYILRPEAIESLFVLYRVTGRAEFQEAAWAMFEAVRRVTATDSKEGGGKASAAVVDVMSSSSSSSSSANGSSSTTSSWEHEDYMESFWLAETLKYFYLAFSPPEVVSLDEFVLNTEAHPFRRG